MTRRLWLALVLLAAFCTGAAANPIPGEIVINEVVYDSEGTDVNTWLELKGEPGLPLDGFEVVGVNGNGGVDYQLISLNGFVVPADGYFVIAQSAAFPGADMIDANVNYQNGPDSIQLRYQGTVVDAVGYQTHGGGDVFAGEGSPAPDQVPPNSIARCPDGFDSNDNSVDFRLDDTPTPGAANDAYCPAGLGACCLADGSCIVVSGDECAQQGGSYLGDDTVCDPYPCPPQPASLCEVAADDADGRPVLLNRLVEVEGVCIAASLTWSTTTQDFSITDGDCCMSIFGGPIDPIVQIGDRVRVVGTVAFYNGRTEISTPSLQVTVLSSGNPIPDPTMVSTFELSVNGEQYESCYLGISCVEIVGGDPWPAEGLNANLQIDDGSGPVTMRVDKDTNIDGSPQPVGAFTVFGIGWQFDSSAPYSDGYQILPRSLDDFLFNCGPVEGACCFEDGSCQVITGEDCAAQGGSFQGPGTGCDPNPCPQPMGACCLEDGTCVVVTEAECAGLNGAWLGAGTDCDPDPCAPPASGACCFETGECVILTGEACAQQNGTYQGDGTLCEPNPCIVIPTERTTWGKIKDQYR